MSCPPQKEQDIFKTSHVFVFRRLCLKTWQRRPRRILSRAWKGHGGRGRRGRLPDFSARIFCEKASQSHRPATGSLRLKDIFLQKYFQRACNFFSSRLKDTVARLYSMKTPLLLFALIILLDRGVCAGKDSCFDCHRVMEGMSLKFVNDIHYTNGISCAKCHGGDPNESDQNISMNASRGFKVRVTRQGIPEYCGSCHTNASLHGQIHAATAGGSTGAIQDQRSRQAAGRRWQAGGRVCGLPQCPQYPRGQQPAFNRQSATHFQDVRQVPCRHRRRFRRLAAWSDVSTTSAAPAALSATPPMPRSRPPRPCSPVQLLFASAAISPGLRPLQLAEDMAQILTKLEAAGPGSKDALDGRGWRCTA